MAANLLRTYQKKIVDTIGSSNAIVKMPTGSGKTVVAAQLVANHLQKNLNSSLFLVPTQDLVAQQAQVIQHWCPEAEILQFTGGMVDPSIVDGQKTCLVSTPKAYLLLQQRKPAFSWPKFGFVIFDEVHHVLKDHPYRHIALGIKRFLETDQEKSHRIQVLGLSASLTYAVADTAITSTLNRICHELHIEKMISPTVEELVEDGYISQHGRNIEVERAADLPEGLIPREERKPHLMHSQFMARVKTNTATDFSQAYWEVVCELEKKAKQEYSGFESPLEKAKLSSWEDYAHRLASSRKSSVWGVLENWYVGLRILVQTWEEEQHLVLLWLAMKHAFDINVDRSMEAFLKLKTQADDPANFLKMDRLCFHLKEKRSIKGSTFRCLIFAQKRITTVILSHFINTNPALQALGLKAEFVAARNSQIAPGLSVTKEMASTSINKFRQGVSNIIVTTSVLEEVRIFWLALPRATTLS